MTAGDRLRSLAGAAGTAGALLLLIGSGSTAGAALVNYSRLPTGTAAQHLLTDVVRTTVTGGGFGKSGRRPQIVVVSVDGQDYRVHIDNLAAFLESIKEEVKETAPAKKVKKLKQDPPKIVIKSAPPEYMATAVAAVERTNVTISNIWMNYLTRKLEELEDDEVLALLLA